MTSRNTRQLPRVVPEWCPVPDDGMPVTEQTRKETIMAKEETKNTEIREDEDLDLATEDGLELALSSEKFEKLNLQRDITGGGKGFCSMTAVDNAAKVTLYNACSNPVKVSDFIGKQIKLMHFYVEVIQTVSEQTGELVSVPRVVLIDDHGKGYQAVSVGMYNSIKRVVAMFGLPDEWDKPHTVEIQQVNTKSGRTFNLLLID